jgi:broad specificity phosphatase PhoE
VLLLRHGQSTWNAEGRWQGRSDPPLSDRGRAEADLAAAHDALNEVSAVAASDLVRATATAEILAAFRDWGPVTVIAGLRERDVGAFTGLTRAEIEARWPGILARVPLEPPGAEPRPAVLARAVAALHRLAEKHPGESVVAVTHGALIRALEAHLGVAEPGPPPNLTGRWVTVVGGRLTAGPRAVLLPPPATPPTATPSTATPPPATPPTATATPPTATQPTATQPTATPPAAGKAAPAGARA